MAKKLAVIGGTSSASPQTLNILLGLVMLCGTALGADDLTALASGTSLAEDKPPCVKVTRYVPVGDGTNVLKSTLVFFGTTTTNADNKEVDRINLPVGLGNGLLPTSTLEVPAGANIILSQPADARQLGPATLSSFVQIKASAMMPGLESPNVRPQITLQSPHQGIVTQPLLQIHGFTDKTLRGVTYDILNDVSPMTNQQGWVTDVYYDDKQGRFTTNYFDCNDINLAPGTNVLVLRLQFASGGLATLNLPYVLRLDLKTNSPMVQIDWPFEDEPICDDQVTIRGQVDDCSDFVAAEVNVNGRTKTIEGVVERDGHFWLENIPLASPTNVIKIIAKDVVGHVSSFPMTILKSDDRLVIHPPPPRSLWQMQVTVTGTVNPPNRAVLGQWTEGRSRDKRQLDRPGPADGRERCGRLRCFGCAIRTKAAWHDEQQRNHVFGHHSAAGGFHQHSFSNQPNDSKCQPTDLWHLQGSSNRNGGHRFYFAGHDQSHGLGLHPDKRRFQWQL